MAKVIPHLIRNFFNCSFSAPESWICIDQTGKWTEQFSLTLDMLSWTMNRYVPKWLPTPLAPNKTMPLIEERMIGDASFSSLHLFTQGRDKKENTALYGSQRGKVDGWISVMKHVIKVSQLLLEHRHELIHLTSESEGGKIDVFCTRLSLRIAKSINYCKRCRENQKWKPCEHKWRTLSPLRSTKLKNQ